MKDVTSNLDRRSLRGRVASGVGLVPVVIHLLVLVLVLIGATDRLAQAQGKTATVDNLSLRMRITPPLAQWISIDPGVGSPGGGLVASMVGISVGAEWRAFWAFEAGTAALLTSLIEPPSYDWFLRLGIAPRVADWRRRDGLGWTAQCDLLGGYRHFMRFRSSNDLQHSEVTDGVTANAGIELSRFFANRTAVTLRLLSTFTLPLTQTQSRFWRASIIRSYDLQYAIDLGFTIGLAF